MILNLLIGFSFMIPSEKDSLAKVIDAHFSNTTPELLRYGKLTYYGETLSGSQLPDSILNQEIEFFEIIMDSGLLSEPLPKSYLLLCHNLLVHKPSIGQLFLKALSKPTFFKNNSSFFYTELIAAEEFGEHLAIESLTSHDVSWRRTISEYLHHYAIYESSIDPLLSHFATEQDPQVKNDIVFALNNIGSPSALPFVKNLIETTKDDTLQRAAIYTYAELAGFSGIKYLKSVKPVGPYSRSELKESISWLKKETNKSNPFGTQIVNDRYFIDLYGDLRTTSMVWLDKNGYLKLCRDNKPLNLDSTSRVALFESLVDSKAFGIEAVKGSLFQQPDIKDLPWLLRLRALTFYSPNAQSKDRSHSLLILIRQLRRSR